ncbi:MAG: hypothetical protein HYZ14_12385 [Bacteroidetes bacterium]|nr:hypothetical protein [Bacteroidota bacterium]
MRLLLFMLFAVALVSCRKNMLHERWISNASDDTIFAWNPDFEDTIYVIAPAQKAMVYSYEILDKEQESEVCQWMGDTLYIVNAKDSICEKPVSRESNWFSDVSGDKKHRKQVCTFTLYNENF